MKVKNTTKNVSEAREKESPRPTEGGVPSYISTLYQICQEEEIDFRFLSRNWVKRLEKNGKVRFIAGHKFDLNPAVAGAIADDKYATYSILKDAEVPVAECAIIYPKENQNSFAQGCNSLACAQEYFAAHENSIVIKPNHGTLSRGVVWVREMAQLPLALMEVFYWDKSASMCPFYNTRRQYRVVMLDGEAELAFARSNWLFNQGPRVEDPEVPEPTRERIIMMAQKAVAAIGLRFCTVDFIETMEGELLILEVNSGVMLEKYVTSHPEDYEIVKGIYRSAIRKMFE